MASVGMHYRVWHAFFVWVVREGLIKHDPLDGILDCGLRLNELIRLRLADVSLAQRSLKVHGKGAKDRIVFMGARTTKALRRYLEIRGFKPGYSDTLFIDRKGESLKSRWVPEVVARLGKKAGLKIRNRGENCRLVCHVDASFTAPTYIRVPCGARRTPDHSGFWRDPSCQDSVRWSWNIMP